MGSDEPLFKTLAQIADAIVGSFPRHLEVVVHDRSLPGNPSNTSPAMSRIENPAALSPIW